MSMWTTSTTGLETALAAAIGSTLQQHTITNNLKGGQTHILHFGNSNSATPHHNNNNTSASSSHHHSNSSSSHSNHQHPPATHHGSNTSFFANSNPNLSHSSHNNVHSATWARNNICSNHKVSPISDAIALFKRSARRHSYFKTKAQCNLNAYSR